jgi:hypothetical protein
LRSSRPGAAPGEWDGRPTTGSSCHPFGVGTNVGRHSPAASDEIVTACDARSATPERPGIARCSRRSARCARGRPPGVTGGEDVTQGGHGVTAPLPSDTAITLRVVTEPTRCRRQLVATVVGPSTRPGTKGPTTRVPTLRRRPPPARLRSPMPRYGRRSDAAPAVDRHQGHAQDRAQKEDGPRGAIRHGTGDAGRQPGERVPR